MRSVSYGRGTSSSSSLPWGWISIVGGIIALLFLVRVFSGSGDADSSENYLSVTPGEQSSVYISMTSASKNRISSTEKLFASDKSVSVELGSAIAKNSSMTLDIDKGSEVSYKSSSASGDSIALTKGRIWIKDITVPLVVELKNYTLNAPVGSILLVEQNGPYSNTYMLGGSATAKTTLGDKDISAGSMISLLKSDIANPATNLSEWVRPIEGAIIEYPLFVRNQGSDLLKAAGISPEGLTGSWTPLSSWSLSTISQNSTAVIEVTEPKVNTMTKETTITVMGNILSKDVKRVTINNADAVVSPVNATFVLQGVPVTGEVFDIVYKAYDAGNTLLQVGVLSVYGSKGAAEANGKLVPETFPVSAKDFKITSPTTNPYSTTERFIKVQWTLPKNTVDHIVVNDYQLQKYIPNSGSWYYFANMDTGTMKDGLNLYTIKFYSADNTLLYSQPFTIIKESKNATVSAEVIR
jgi:hypothetical protein